ncbi:MAG: NAD(P) transhydrogenase subunit beta [candidate division BRC1 bacterium ADurb.BinA292]|nr:MAG: NAD(P) transhydrogenase subunit beta [candidate division BRC1 bacterium ADurb.BinA292]
MSATWQNLAYLIVAVLFILGLKGLAHPRSAPRGNLLGALGMLLAIVATLAGGGIISWGWIFVGLAIGGVIGLVLALKVQMTAMPQMVALLNGFGGAASFLVAATALALQAEVPAGFTLQFTIATAASGVVGSVTFWGSLVAFWKLQGLPGENWQGFPGVQLVNMVLVLLCVALGWIIVAQPPAIGVYWLLVLVAAVLGVLLVVPIGGADMPVVIALLNSYSGVAAAATGFVLSNSVLIISGSLVGASGLILTAIMCKAMNRSLPNVLFAKFGGESSAPKADDIYEGKVKATTAEELAMMLEDARRVVFIPGYGMAVAQAQYAVRDLANLLESRGINVEYAIHPVAGRMPGHMNVLLAEANVPYEKLREMDDINPEMAQVDVAIVLGANDVVNPLARADGNSPIAGMPIIDADKARQVVVVKRSLSPGYAGIPNPLFAADNTVMFFNDGKKAVQEIIAAVKAT